MSKNAVLVINCGSSSLKFSLIKPESSELIVSGIAERLLTDQAFIKIKYNGEKTERTLGGNHDHEAALESIVSFLLEHKLEQSLIGVGHRIVHGGETYSAPTLVTDAVKASIGDLAKLAPLHNPVNLIGIEAAEKAFPSLPQVTVFDTAFHQTMPKTAYLTGLPYSFYEQHGIRNYGFHGTSHYFVSKRAAELVNKPYEQSSFISAHLGNGCSVTAIENGQSVDTSMGLTPLAGVVMGTRSGDVDPGVIFHLVEKLNYSIEEVSHILNKESGLLGISEMSNDCRTIEDAILNDNNPRANLTMDIFCYRIAKTISSYMASLSHFDGLIFTGGIGENSDLVRSRIVRSLSLLNLNLDEAKNVDVRFGKEGFISAQGSRNCMVIPTNEEQVIAEQTFDLIQEN
ncbi:acetate kinase [Thalassotalea aquiviva]|uniref:acetate kinase n=1 Tax=Thalassotalea aquiviva TaxID=3242415 RepID=UPI00352A4575